VGAKAAVWGEEIRLVSLSIAAAAGLYAAVTASGVFPPAPVASNAVPTQLRVGRVPVVPHRVRTIVIPSLVQLPRK
jgi:hypothetical protein